MGVIKQGILGGVSGKVGSIIGTSWKGRDVLRTRPTSVTDRKTASQLNQRLKWTVITKLGGILTPALLKPFWDKQVSGISGYNQFCKENVNAVDPDGDLDWNLVVGSIGRLVPLTIVSMDTMPDTHVTVNFTTPMNDPYALPTDNLIAAIYDIVNKNWLVVPYAITTRSTLVGNDAVQIPHPTMTLPTGTPVLLFFCSANTNLASRQYFNAA